MDYIIVGLIIAGSVFFSVRRLYRSLKPGAKGCCGSCTSCGGQDVSNGVCRPDSHGGPGGSYQ